jgi:hypothetical protein
MFIDPKLRKPGDPSPGRCPKRGNASAAVAFNRVVL